MNMKIEAIWWQDAYVTVEDNPEFKNHQALTLSIGHVTKEEGGLVYMSHFYDGIGGQWESPWTTVPKSLIKKRMELKEVSNGRCRK